MTRVQCMDGKQTKESTITTQYFEGQSGKYFVEMTTKNKHTQTIVCKIKRKAIIEKKY